MELTVIVAVAASIFLWGLVSPRLERADLTAPIASRAAPPKQRCH